MVHHRPAPEADRDGTGRSRSSKGGVGDCLAGCVRNESMAIAGRASRWVRKNCCRYVSLTCEYVPNNRVKQECMYIEVPTLCVQLDRDEGMWV